MKKLIFLYVLNIFVVIQLSAQNFAPAVTYSVDSLGIDWVVEGAADVDSDGDMDLLGRSVNMTGSFPIWLENDGTNQSFATHVIDTVNIIYIGHMGIAAGDLDLDGDSDIVVATAWYENDGSSNFTAHPFGFSNTSSSIQIADIDKDGDQDIFSWGAGIKWYKNDGALNFTKIVIDSISLYDGQMLDWDGDGDFDVIGSDGSTTYLHENDGNGGCKHQATCVLIIV